MALDIYFPNILLFTPEKYLLNKKVICYKPNANVFMEFHIPGTDSL